MAQGSAEPGWAPGDRTGNRSGKDKLSVGGSFTEGCSFWSFGRAAALSFVGGFYPPLLRLTPWRSSSHCCRAASSLTSGVWRWGRPPRWVTT